MQYSHFWRMVLKSMDYKSISVDGLPFDHQKGIVPNIRGRVLRDTSGDTILFGEGLYVCGWLEREQLGLLPQTSIVLKKLLQAFLKTLRKECRYHHLTCQSQYGGRVSPAFIQQKCQSCSIH